VRKFPRQYRSCLGTDPPLCYKCTEGLISSRSASYSSMPNYKVFLLDGIDPAGVDVIRRSNSIEPIVHDKISRQNLLDIVGDADGLIVRSSTAVDRELMQKAKRLKVVGRA